MTIKSLTITEDAYEALKMLKYGNESFSEVILRMSKEKVGLSAKFCGAVKITREAERDWRVSIRKRREELNKEFEKRGRKIRSSL